MNDPTQKALSASITALLRPLVRLMLRHGIAFGTFAEVVKRVYVSVAEEDFALEKRKQSQSRIAVLTGLTRKEVLRISRIAEDDVDAFSQRPHRAARVISGWLHDSDFHDSRGRPASLELDNGPGNFGDLVARYSGDMTMRAMVDELLRVGAVVQLKNGKLKLTTSAYVPVNASPEALTLFGADVADLIETIDYNLDPDTEGTRFQLKTSYDNLSDQDAEAFCQWADPQSMMLIRRFDEWLATHDRDNPQSTHSRQQGAGRNRIGVGIYLFREDLSSDNLNLDNKDQ
jgi:hypothetical protein